MKSWHRHYKAKVYPVKVAIGQYLQSKNGTRGMVMQSCHSLMLATASLIADKRALSAPDVPAEKALKAAMSEFKAGAEICRLQPEAEEVKTHMGAAEKSLAEAAQALKRYWLNL